MAIPRVIHQTFRTRKLTLKQEKLVQSWKLHNPSWQYKFYDDLQAQAFVAEEFPSWLHAYNALPLPVERADFFRWGIPFLYNVLALQFARAQVFICG